MAIFSVATVHPVVDALLRSRITEHFPTDHFEIGRGQWLVSFNGTAKALFEQLAQGDQQAINGTTVFSVGGYYGLASVAMWEWIATKLGGKSA
jgi:hypothetical protein